MNLKQPKLTPERVIHAAASYFNVSILEMLTPSGKRTGTDIVMARYVSAYIIRNKCENSPAYKTTKDIFCHEELAAIFNLCAHTQSATWVSKVNLWRTKNNPKFKHVSKVVRIAQGGKRLLPKELPVANILTVKNWITCERCNGMGVKPYPVPEFYTAEQIEDAKCRRCNQSGIIRKPVVE